MERQSRVATAEERATATKSREGQREIVFYWTPESGVTQWKWELHPPCAKREEAMGQIELQPEMLPEVERVGEKHPNFCLPTTIQFPNSTFPFTKPSQKPADTGVWEMQPAETRQGSVREGPCEDLGHSGPALNDLPSRNVTIPP